MLRALSRVPAGLRAAHALPRVSAAPSLPQPCLLGPTRGLAKRPPSKYNLFAADVAKELKRQRDSPVAIGEIAKTASERYKKLGAAELAALEARAEAARADFEQKKAFAEAPKAPKRRKKRTAYQAFFKEKHGEVQGGLVAKQQYCRGMWAALSEGEKGKYQEKADALNEELGIS